MREYQTITSLENKYMTKQSRNPITILLDIDKWQWDEDEITEFKEMWQSGEPLTEITKRFKCEADEIALLLIHLKRRKEIKPREYKISNLVKEN